MSEDIQVKLTEEAVNMIAITASHWKAGRQWSWVRGMIRHHLPIALERVMNHDLPDLWSESFTDEMTDLIREYVTEQEHAGVDMSSIRLKLDLIFQCDFMNSCEV